MALVEIQYPYSWNNVVVEKPPDSPYGSNEIRIWNDEVAEEYGTYPKWRNVTVKPGFFKEIEQLLAAVQQGKENLSAHLKDLDYERKYHEEAFSLKFDHIHQKVILECNRKTRIELSALMQYMLGFKQRVFSKTTVADYPPDLRGGIDSLYVYCDLCEPQIVGNSMERLIRILPVGGEYGEVIHRVFAAPHYVGVLHRDFSTVEISIKTDGNLNVPFAFGKTVVKLHFRRKRLYQI